MYIVLLKQTYGRYYFKRHSENTGKCAVYFQDPQNNIRHNLYGL
jgi:hypothetical protein